MNARLALLLPCLAFACGLESAGQSSSDAGSDRGTGVTDSGVVCACLPKIDAPWQYVSVQRDGTSPCIDAWATTTPRVVVEASGPPLTCGCSCTSATAPTCTFTGATVTTYANNNCGGGPDKTITGNVACYDINPDYNPSGTVSAKGTATFTTTGGSCNPPVPTPSPPSPPEVHTGQACPLVGGLGSGCAASDACVPAPPAGATVCVVTNAADAACPSGYPNKRRVGSSFTDGRACGTCTCGATADCKVEAQFFDDNGTCGGSKKEGQPFLLDGVCHVATTTGVAGHSLGATVAGVQKCVAQGFEPKGAITLADEFTLCCP